MIQMNLHKTETDSENELIVVRGRMGEGIVGEFGVYMYTLLYLKWITSKDLLGTLLSVMWQPGREGSLGENRCVYMCG